MSLWDRFDTIATPDEVTVAKSQFSPTEAGEYDTILEAIEAGESTTGLPMLKVRFRDIATNKVIFYNQLLQNVNYPDMTAKNIAEAVNFVSGMIGEEYEFTGLGAFADFISSIVIGEQHRIEVSYNKKDVEMKYAKVKVLPSKPLDMSTEQYGDSDIPF